MKTLTLPLATLAFLSLAACGERNGPPPPQADTADTPETVEGEARRGEPGPPAEDADELLDRVGMAADDSYEPEVTAEAGGSMRLDGPLAEGEWQDMGAQGTGFSRTGFEPVASFRCAADENGVIVTVPAPQSAQAQDTDETDSQAAESQGEDDPADTAETQSADDAAGTAPAGASGSLITASGTANGRFEPVQGDPSSWEMRVPANHPALSELPAEGRIGVSLENQEIRRMPLSPMLVEQVSGCSGETG